MDTLAFIGGGNMAGAIIGGLIRRGRDPRSVIVVDPGDAPRERLHVDFGVRTLQSADATLEEAGVIVWAVKPQFFAVAALPCAPHVRQALHLSVMAGIRSDSIALSVGTQRVVRAMPNTPALIGQGIAGLFARDAVSDAERRMVEGVLATTGQWLWLAREEDLDAVTALSGSGPAYVFYFIEAMIQAAVEMGLTAQQGRAMALATFSGAAALAAASEDPPEVLRERVTSKGGTTHAAVAVLESKGVKAAFVEAMRAAQTRARALGDEFGG